MFDEDGITDLLDQPQALSTIDLPTLTGSQVPECTLNSTCSRAEFFASFNHRAPIHLPGTTPVYSNAAFQILSYALENITNRTFEASLNESILKATDLTSTSLSTPADSDNGVIPVNKQASGWARVFGDEAP